MNQCSPASRMPYKTLLPRRTLPSMFISGTGYEYTDRSRADLLWTLACCTRLIYATFESYRAINVGVMHRSKQETAGNLAVIWTACLSQKFWATKRDVEVREPFLLSGSIYKSRPLYSSNCGYFALVIYGNVPWTLTILTPFLGAQKSPYNFQLLLRLR